MNLRQQVDMDMAIFEAQERLDRFGYRDQKSRPNFRVPIWAGIFLLGLLMLMASVLLLLVSL